jgi:subtilisin family serine protease
MSALRADVAELVDAHGSGPCARKGVEVQVLSSASIPAGRTSHFSMTRLATLLVVALAVLAVGSEPAQLVAPAQAADRVQVVVALSSPPPGLAPGSARRIAAEQRLFRSELARRLPDARVRWRYRLVANGFSVVLPAEQIPALRSLRSVRDVLESATYEPQLDATPQQIGAPALWGAGLDTAGQGVKIGIIDTGVDQSHAFFDPTGYAMPAGFPKGQTRFTNAKVIVARAFAPPRANRNAERAVEGSLSDHGTHVAGIAAGNPRTRANAATVSGVAPRAYIGNYRALVGTEFGLSPNGNAPEIIAAIEAAVRDGMDVINLSIGEPEIEPRRDLVARALDAAAAAGVVPVAAAGNDFNDLGAGSVISPANSAAAISVAAVEIGGSPPAGVHADFSSVGPTSISLRMKPDIAAPGVGVLSSVPAGWAALSGTSMATPHVSGAAALLVQRHPAWTVAQVKSALVQSASDARVQGSGAAGPEFQGGGVVALQKADNPLVFAAPTGVSFGLIARGARRPAGVLLTDAGGGAGTWQVAGIRREAPAGASVALPATVDVPGTLSFEAVTVAAAAQGVLSGYVELRRGGDVRRIPYWGRVSVAGLAKHRPLVLRRPGLYRGTTQGRPARAVTYRYPESPRGLGVTQTLSGPETVYRFRLRKRVANFGVVITERGRGSAVEPRAVAGLDENRLLGYGGLPFNNNPYLQGFRREVLAAGALAPLPGEYAFVFDSASRGGAGRFTFRLWVDDVTPPTLRLQTRSVRIGSPLRVGARDGGSGVYPGSITARIDGENVSASFRGGVVGIGTSGFGPGRHRLVLRVSDYQETKNTENVARILPNTRELRTTFTVRG